MWIRSLRWFLIAAPVVAGVLLLIFGTAGAISAAFGVTLIGIAAIVWMWNWFIRMSFNDQGRERESQAREGRAHEQHANEQRARDRAARERSAAEPRPAPERPQRMPPPRHPGQRKLSRRPRRPD